VEAGMWRMNPSLKSVLLWLERSRDLKNSIVIRLRIFGSSQRVIPERTVYGRSEKTCLLRSVDGVARGGGFRPFRPKGADSSGSRWRTNRRTERFVVDWVQQWRAPGGGSSWITRGAA